MWVACQRIVASTQIGYKLVLKCLVTSGSLWLPWSLKAFIVVVEEVL